ncbi:MAG: 7-cyano-7-deazaguanine synthase QueC [Gemmatimonadetes bacterium]|nr:7-cyano-7-deazaguanine synthase QueC [Gemmatimonadota bacterium]
MKREPTGGGSQGNRASEPGKAVVLLSGGLDSATALAVARSEGLTTFALTLRYGQRHGGEAEAAARVARAAGVERHLVMDVDLARWGGSSLVSESGDLASVDRGAADRAIPDTYVPARNTIFLSLGLAWAEALGADQLFVGVSQVDCSGYPDCRAEFIDAFQKVIDTGTKAGVEGRAVCLRAPLLHLSKADTIRLGLELGVDYGLTTSCYDPGPSGDSCNACESCALRARAFQEVGDPDPGATGRVSFGGGASTGPP